MQLPAQSDGAAPVEAHHDSGSSPQQQQGGGVRRVSGKAPASSTTSTSPSSPGSPSRSGGGGAAGPAGALRDKPVKLLPCPRCESMNTKFCYYNNYSVTQPRHFCRQCQRYWTAGGTLRNVPVGGGSRKKNRHPRGEPYLQQRGLNGVGVGGVSPPGPFGISSAGGQSVLQNAGGHFQQMLSQDMGFAQLNFSQLPGFPANGYHHQQHHAYGNTTMDPVDLSQQVMYGTAPQMHPVAPYFFPQQETQQPAVVPPPFPNETTGTVKTEFWSHPSMIAPPAPSNPNPSKNGQTFESSMLLNLGLNNNNHRPPQQQEPGMTQQAKPVWDQSQSQQHQADVKPTVRAPTTKNGSPPHGSSTIEEEGSTPTNSYSNSGYEEGDTVSSMWHNIHDMENIFQ